MTCCPSPAVRVRDEEVCKQGVANGGNLLFTIAAPAPVADETQVAVITVAGIAWSYSVAPVNKGLFVVINNFVNTTRLALKFSTAGFGAVYFTPNWEFVLERTTGSSPSLVITLEDPAAAGGEFTLNLLGYNYRSYSR